MHNQIASTQLQTIAACLEKLRRTLLTQLLNQAACSSSASSFPITSRDVCSGLVKVLRLAAALQYLDLWPDPNKVSCMSAFNRTHTSNFVDRTGGWHHLATTWTKAGNGRTRIYKDGLLMAEV